MPKNVPPLLLLLSLASDVSATVIYRTAKELKEMTPITKH